MSLVDSVGRSAAFFAVIAVPIIVSKLLSLSSAKARPLAGDQIAGAIAPGKVSAYFTVAVGTTMALGGAFCIYEGRLVSRAVALLLFGLVIAAFMAPSLTAAYNVYWTAQDIQGPSKLFGPALATARTTIRWSEIVKSGITSTRYWYVESNDGRRIYWSYLYPGYAALTAALRLRCPRLALPRDMR